MGVVGPQCNRKQRLLQQVASGSSRSAAFLDPVAQGAPRQMHAVSDQDIFEPVEREVVGELADQHEGDQLPGRRFRPSREASETAGWPRRRGTSSKRTWAGSDVHFEFGRGELELTGEVFADALFSAAATRAGLLGLGQIVLDAVMGEMVERRSSLGACRLGPPPGVAVSGLCDGCGRFDLERRVVEVEQMTLTRIVVEAFATGTEDIEAKQPPTSRPVRRVSLAIGCSRPRSRRARRCNSSTRR